MASTTFFRSANLTATRTARLNEIEIATGQSEQLIHQIRIPHGCEHRINRSYKRLLMLAINLAVVSTRVAPCNSKGENWM